MVVVFFMSCPDSSEKYMTYCVDCVHPKSRAEGVHDKTLQNLPALHDTLILFGSFLVLHRLEYSHQVKGEKYGFWKGKATQFSCLSPSYKPQC